MVVLPVSFCSEYCRYSLHVAVASRSRFAAAVTASPLSMLLVSRGWRQFLNAEDATRHVAVERRKQPATQERSNPTIALLRFTMKAVLEEGTSSSTTLSGAKTIEVRGRYGEGFYALHSLPRKRRPLKQRPSERSTIHSSGTKYHYTTAADKCRVFDSSLLQKLIACPSFLCWGFRSPQFRRRRRFDDAVRYQRWRPRSSLSGSWRSRRVSRRRRLPSPTTTRTSTCSTA